MKKVLISLFAAVILCGTAHSQNRTDWANFGRYAEANAAAPRGADAVFMGNSITEGWARNSPDFFQQNKYIGRGIGGQVTSQMLVRFRPDVIELRPKCVVILAGTNDIAMNQGYISLENICGNIISMAELARHNGIKVVICSVLPAYEFPWRKEVEQPARKVITLNVMLREYAFKNNIPYVDFHSAMQDERDGLPEKYAGDGIHPNGEGYAVMETIIKPVIDKLVK